MESVVRWFIDNPIAAKLLMVVVVIGGLSAFPRLDKEFFPEHRIDLIRVSVAYPGAGPAEVEKQICSRIEEAVQDINGIEEIRSSAREAFGEVVIEIKSGEDTLRILNDVKTNVDAIDTFPVESEKPQVVEQRFKQTVMQLILAGDVDERTLKELGERIREDLAALPDVDQAQLLGTRRYQFGIEVSEDALRDYGLTFDEVANAIRGYSLNLPGGKIRDVDGDILVQTRAQAYTSQDFADITLRRRADGALLRVGDVASVIDGFEDIDAHTGLNGVPALTISVLSQNNPNILKTHDAVTEYVEQANLALPDGLSLSVWMDMSINYKGRLNTLVYNGTGGLLLVFLVLVVFLSPSLALWVCGGIAVAFLGSIALLSLTPITLNIISMFAFIMILGIVVDDAIIVGESIYSYQRQPGADKKRAAVLGAVNVMAPVWFAVLSTMVFFVPFLFIGDGPEPNNMAIPVLLALSFSLFESLLLLPSHLGNAHNGWVGHLEDYVRHRFAGFVSWLQALEQRRQRIANTLPRFGNTHYRRLLVLCIAHKGQTILVFLFLFSFSVAVMSGGWLGMSFFPKVASDSIIAEATLSESAPHHHAMAITRHLEAAANKLVEEVNEEVGYPLMQSIKTNAFDNIARVRIRLDRGDRPYTNRELANRWREYIGEFSGVREFEITFSIREMPKPIEFLVLSEYQPQLEGLNNDLTAILADIPGVINVRSSLEDPATEIELKLKPEAETLFVNLRDVSRQVRRAFYGEEVQRIPLAREDVKVLVRYPQAERSYEEALRDMYVRSLDGKEVPLETVADIEYVEGFRKIERLDRRRVARISADLQPGFRAMDVISSIEKDWVTTWQSQYPDTIVSLDGEQKEQSEFVSDLQTLLLLAMVTTFGLMAIMFGSYWQPLLVLSAIPFGYMGAILGHIVIGIDLSMFSLLGMMACAGVVVNDNVVLIDRINKLRAKGLSPLRAAVEGAIQRFRPIVLTSVTTFLGLTPILLEQSVQAAFLKPMVVSLAAGVLVASLVTLCFVPALYLVFERFIARLGRVFSVRPMGAAESQ